jgi:adenine-specific DNA-methyltransferase
VNAAPTDRNKKRLVDKSTEMLCLKEDCFDEIKRTADYAIFKNGQDKHLGIVYEDDGIEPFKKEAKRLNRKIAVYVFSLDESAREEEFEDVKGLVDLKPIPAVILNVYKRIFR